MTCLIDLWPIYSTYTIRHVIFSSLKVTDSYKVVKAIFRVFELLELTIKATRKIGMTKAQGFFFYSFIMRMKDLWALRLSLSLVAEMLNYSRTKRA